MPFSVLAYSRNTHSRDRDVNEFTATSEIWIIETAEELLVTLYNGASW